MGHTHTRLLVHVIFSTKDRIPYLVSDRRNEIFRYMSGILKNLNCSSLSIGGVSDHAHMFFELPQTASVADIVGKVKGNSSKWIHDSRVLPRSFAWQRGYAAFGVSDSSADAVLRFIAEQERHHQKWTFQDEIRLFLTKNRIAFDEKYLWE
jgi:putative transposase